VDEAQTVSFVAGGFAYALDPATLDTTCAAAVGDPGPFLWGPLGDRVLLAGLQVAWVTAAAPASEATDVQPLAEDWGHPVGIAVVYSEQGSPIPQKLLLETNTTERFHEMPHGTYLDVAYHPSGLALAYVLERKGVQSIWYSTNEGTDPKRLVFTKEGTTFTDVAFSPDGQDLTYIAEHAEGYPAYHWIDLSDPGTLETGWKGDVGQYVRRFFQAPRGHGVAIDLGETCEDSRAAVLAGPNAERPLLPGERRPSSVVGWLDGDTILVSAGPCDGPVDLFAVSSRGGDVTPLVTGVEAAASRAPAPKAPHSLPKEVELEGGSGVG
jgi:hypothetical protein